MTISVNQALKDTIKGAIDTSQIKVEILFSGSTYTDVSDRIEGQVSWRFEERSLVNGGSSPNYAVITLNNDDGAFSPKNTASPYYLSGLGLVPNKPIKISIVVGSYSVPVFVGVTGAWPPSARGRTVTVRCFDSSVLLKRKEIKAEVAYNTTSPETGLTYNYVFERAAWLAGIRWDYVETYGSTYSATSQTNEDGSTTATPHAAYDTGRTVAIYRQGGASGTITMRADIIRAATTGPLMLKVTRLEGMGLDVLAKLAEVVDASLFFDAQGALKLRSRMYVGDSSTPAETFDVDNLDDVQFSQNFEGSALAPLINKATVKATPLDFRKDASGAIVEETVSFIGDSFPFRTFNAGQTYPGASDAQQFAELPSNVYILATSAPYPTAANMVIRSGLETDPLKDLEGSAGLVWAAGFPKFGTNRIELKITNNNAASVRLTDLTLKAKLAAPRQRIQAIQQDAVSIGLYGQRDKMIDNPHIPDAVHARNLSAWVVAANKDLKETLKLPAVHGAPWLECGDTVAVSETITNIVPASTNYVVRAYDGTWSAGEFSIVPEVVPPAPAFTLSTGVTGIQEVSNLNNKGATGDSLPFPAIANVGKQVGLTNINAFRDLMASIRKITNAGVAGGTVNGMAFYKGFLWAATSNGYIWQIDPITMATVGQWQPDPNSIFIDCKVYGRYLYVADTVQGAANTHRVIWFDMDNPGTVSGTNWGTKVVLGTLATPVQNPRFLLISGTKLYVHGKEYNSPSFSNQDSRLVVVDVASNSLVTTAEANVETTASASNAVSNVLKMCGGYLWAISRDNPTMKLVTVATLAGATTVTLDAVSGLYVGQPIQIGPSGGGAGTDRVWITAINGSTITVSPAMTYAHPTTDYAFAQSTTIARINPSTYAVDSRTVVNEGFNGQGLESDGRYIWATFLDRIVRYDIASGVPVASKVYLSGSGSAGSAQFDGTYLWWTRAGQIVQLDPRGGSSVAEFADDSSTGGVVLFDGRSIFKSGSGGVVYAVPRWTSQAN